MKSAFKRLLRAMAASLAGWAAATCAFGVVQISSSPQFDGVRPIGLVAWSRLLAFYTQVGAVSCLLLIPVLAVVFLVWSPRRVPRSPWQLAAVAGLVAAAIAAGAAFLAGSSRLESQELLLPFFAVCWAATLAGAVFDRWQSAAQQLVAAGAPKSARR